MFMALKELSTTLQQYVENMEKDLRKDINDFNNLMFEKNASETVIALERAKDYHRQEIVNALQHIQREIKRMVFHQKQLRWFHDEAANFTPENLKRFSYFKKQVYEEIPTRPTLTRSVENLNTRSKKERRRTVSEVSLETLNAWEMYLDQKQEQVEQEKQLEVSTNVPRRTLSNSRSRKKFVSSTLGEFLDGDVTKHSGLESIIDCEEEDTEDNQFLSKSCDDLLNVHNEPKVAFNSLSDLSQGCKLSNDHVIRKEAKCDKPKIVDVIYKKGLQVGEPQ
ncbi:hypothetical protein ABEB36_010130 [Hypothenemus hampei]|uniref:Uncharacterized protein n=1 Tax=Hypothenemus hampei TaxID=57062 RepID=A0ABD1EIM1_HYPHA